MAREANIKSVGEKGFEFFEEKSRELVQENTELKMKQNAVPTKQDLKPGQAATELLTALQQANPAPTSDRDT